MGVSTKILAGILIAVLAMTGVLGYLYKNSLGEVVKLEGEIESVKFEYESVRDDLIDKESDMITVNEGMRKVAIEFMNKQSELQKLKQFKEKLITDPNGSAQKIQKEMDDYIKNISDLTS